MNFSLVKSKGSGKSVRVDRRYWKVCGTTIDRHWYYVKAYTDPKVKGRNANPRLYFEAFVIAKDWDNDFATVRLYELSD